MEKSGRTERGRRGTGAQGRRGVGAQGALIGVARGTKVHLGCFFDTGLCNCQCDFNDFLTVAVF